MGAFSVFGFPLKEKALPRVNRGVGGWLLLPEPPIKKAAPESGWLLPEHNSDFLYTQHSWRCQPFSASRQAGRIIPFATLTNLKP
jgi:hypothetical protein